ncbi:tRNA (guanosine(46)-N7)-methyltransferase TrmB [Paraoerskovia marina]|uniref:tRNA (guanosine(46)-N7)-methyltransferase TrmB n=1 Tax=Paraoerskovia marina TaxID=545619 RepID=UPI000A9CDA31
MPEQNDMPLTRDGEPRFRRETVSFVRRSDRLNTGQQRAWDEHRDEYLVDVPRARATTSVDPSWELDAAAEFGRAAPLVVEVGSGKGEAVLAAAQADPGRDFLALEVYTPGLAHTIRRAHLAGLSNLRLAQVNAPELLEHALAPCSVEEVWTFFPDPWHKARHTKRRLVSPSFAGLVHRVLRPGGLWRLATDWADYAEHMQAVVGADDRFEPLGVDGKVERFDGRVLTSFEEKAHAAGREITDLTYRRR